MISIIPIEKFYGYIVDYELVNNPHILIKTYDKNNICSCVKFPLSLLNEKDVTPENIRLGAIIQLLLFENANAQVKFLKKYIIKEQIDIIKKESKEMYDYFNKGTE